MHVAINATFWNQPYVGSGQYTRSLVYYLNRLVSDLEITLIVPQVPGAPEPEAVPPSVHVKSVPARAGQIGKVIFEQIQFPRACREVGADIAHVPYWGAPLRSPIPLAVTVHDLTPLLVPEYRRSLKARLYNALVSASARGANHVITDSFAAKLDIVDYLGAPEEVVTAVYLAVGSEYSVRENSLLDTAVLRKYDLPDFYILYLGGYELHKNINTLLLAWSYVGPALGTDYPLILAGRKPQTISAVYPDYDQYIKALGIEAYVRWVGFVDEADKPVLYRNAELFVFPSRHEGFGLPALEALACGTAVVTTTGDSLPEVIGDAGFAVDPDNDRAMAGAIIAAVTEDDLRAELKQKAQQQAAKFSWEKTIAQTLAVYDQIAGGRRKGKG